MVTDEALIAESMIWPNFFLMNVFLALKGSKLFIIFYQPNKLCLSGWLRLVVMATEMFSFLLSHSCVLGERWGP